MSFELRCAYPIRFLLFDITQKVGILKIKYEAYVNVRRRYFFMVQFVVPLDLEPLSSISTLVMGV